MEPDEWPEWYETYPQTSEGTVFILFDMGSKSGVHCIYWRLPATPRFELCFIFAYAFLY